MKKVIKHPKKMKNAMYIVFGVFSLALFAITRIHPSYANEGLMLDDALDAIVLYGEVEQLPEAEEVEEVQEIEQIQEVEEDEDIVNPEETSDEEINEDKASEDLDETVLKRDNMGIDKIENKEESQINGESYGERDGNEDNSTEIVATENDFKNSEFIKPGILNQEILSNTKTIKYHPNGGFFPGMEKDEILEVKYSYNGETIYINNIQIPNRTVTNGDNCKGWMFAGWFTHPGVNNDRGNEWLGIIDENTESQTVYAKWLKFNDLSFNFSGNNIKIMDRNLGAEQTANGDWSYGYGPFDDVKSLGYYYKWGNNHGFTNRSPVIINDSINISDYGINTGYYSSTFQESLDNMNIWGGLSESDFDKQGPCPLGYHIPSITEWKKFNELFYENIDCSSYQDKMTCYSKVLKLPYSTQLRKNNDGEYTDEFRSASHDTYYIGNVDKYDSYSIFPYYVPTNEIGGFRKENIGPIASNHFSLYLYPIRCFENTEPTRVVTIDYSDGNITQYGLHWRAEKIPYEMIPTIKKDGYKFNGRYNTENGEKISSSTIIESDISIKAMGECIKGYYESEDGYSCLPYTGTIIANGGIGEDEIFEVKVPVNKYRREGYKFVGWNTSENGDGIDYVAGTEIESNGIKLYAKWEKNPRYNFKYIRGPKVEEGEILKYEDIVITSQTDNLDENGNNIPYQNYNNKLYDRIEVLNITGASSLNIKLKYYGNKVNGSNDSDYLLIWTGKYSNYSNILNSGDAIKMYSGWDNYDYETFTITGDSITIGFKSYENTSGPGYGYHIIVEGYGYYENNINYNPTYPGHEFLGWYESGALEQFDFTGTEINQDRTLYAKWKANTYTVSFNADNGETNPGNITVIYDSQYPELPVVNKTGYIFTGWYNGEEKINSGDTVKIIEDTTLKAKRTINQYKIIFDTDGGNEINPIEKNYNSLLTGISLPIPTRECNEFSGWDIELPEIMPAHDITLKAVWNYTCSKSSGGGGTKKTESTTRETAVETPTENEHNSADEQKSDTPETSNTPANGETTSNQVISVTQEVSEDGTIEAVVETIKIKNTDIVATVRTEVTPTNSAGSSSSSATHTREQNDAYSFAKSNGITTTDSIDNAKMNTELTRIQMAKMLSNYAINVLGQEPDVSKGTIKFDDVTNKMDKQYDNAVTKAYQLGIMGQNMKNNEFRPNDEVTRGEFASALSRLLYQTEEGNYKGTGKYYIPHVARLYNEGIINKTDPKIKEKRGYVMTMLMRTVQ